jgi:hypothetical protein
MPHPPPSAQLSRAFHLLTAIPPQDDDDEFTMSVFLQGLPAEQPVDLDTLPADLLILAQQPLVRPIFETDQPTVILDLAGNVTAVTQARKLVQVAITSGMQVLPSWKEIIGVEDVSEV